MAKRAHLFDHALLRLIGLAQIARTLFAQVEKPLDALAQLRMPLQSLKQRFVFASSRHRRLLVSAIYRSILANNISTVRTPLPRYLATSARSPMASIAASICTPCLRACWSPRYAAIRVW
jgi:hypothetical protein